MVGPGHWIGKEKRRDLALLHAAKLPGPDEYYILERPIGAHLTFPCEPKNTTVEKTNEPGPGTYAAYHSVGVLPKYIRDNKTQERMA